MKLIDKAYEKHFIPYKENLTEGDYDIIAEDMIKSSMVIISNTHDNLSLAFSDDKTLKEYKEAFDTAKEGVITITEMAIALSKFQYEQIINKADLLAANLGIDNSSYYNQEGSLLDKILQLTKFTNNNTLHSMVIRAISGERYDMDFTLLREQLFNLYLSYSRLLETLKFIYLPNLDERLLELLIFITSLNILFNIEITDLCQ